MMNHNFLLLSFSLLVPLLINSVSALCPAGSFQETTSPPHTCAECPIGTFSPTANSNLFCSECEGGKHREYSGSTICTDCPAGTIPDAVTGAAACLSCPSGKYNPFQGAVSCLHCDAGKYSSVQGASSCFDCDAGEYAELAGSAECVDCVPGEFAAAGAAECTACETGTVAVSAKAAFCDYCGPGKFADSATNTCKDCEMGEYSLGGVSSCINCEDGKFNAGPGEASCAVESGEAACEGHEFTQSQCAAVGCCHWDQGECLSVIGDGDCDASEQAPDDLPSCPSSAGCSDCLSQDCVWAVDGCAAACVEGMPCHYAMPEYSEGDGVAEACGMLMALEMHAWICTMIRECGPCLEVPSCSWFDKTGYCGIDYGGESSILGHDATSGVDECRVKGQIDDDEGDDDEGDDDFQDNDGDDDLTLTEEEHELLLNAGAAAGKHAGRGAVAVVLLVTLFCCLSLD